MGLRAGFFKEEATESKIQNAIGASFVSYHIRVRGRNAPGGIRLGHFR
jgi:hypothetical protein